MPHATRLQAASMTADHVPTTIRLHRQAFAGYMNVRLGGGYLRRFFRWFIESPRAVAQVALLDGKPMGYVVGVFVGDLPLMERQLKFTVACALLLRPWLVFDGRIRGAIARRLPILRGWYREAANQDDSPRLPEPVLTLTGIGVDPACRGQRIGQSLVEAFEAQARHLGARSLLLFVYPTNTAARKLYERCGWVAGPLPADPSHSMTYQKILVQE